MSNFDHVSDLVAAREKIQNLQQRLETAKADVDAWKMTFNVEVQPVGNSFQLFVAARVGERGTDFVISSQEILSFNGDFPGLAAVVADRAMEYLLREEIRRALLPDFVRGCTNIVALSSKSSL